MTQSDTNTDGIEEGDGVVLSDTHHSHNSELKKNEGRTGEVISVSAGDCLVQFAGMSGDPLNRFWVSPKWLSRSFPADTEQSER